jgi:hypothetical protein
MKKNPKIPPVILLVVTAVLAQVQGTANVRNRYLCYGKKITEYMTLLFYLFKTHLHLFYSLFRRKRQNQIQIHSRIPKKKFERNRVQNADC